MSELFADLEPPVGGRDRLQRGLQRRGQRRRRARGVIASTVTVTVTVTVAVVLTAWLSRPSPADPVVAAPSFDPAAHPAIAVLGGVTPIGAELRGGPGTLRPVATQTDDVVLYLHDPDH